MDSENQNSISFFKGLVYPFKIIDKNSKNFIYIAGSLAFLNSLISLLLGRNILCSSEYNSTEIFCSVNPILFLINSLISMFFACIFIQKWFAVTVENKTLNEIMNLKDYKNYFKILGFIFLYIVIFVIMGCSIWFLQTRIATPNWKFELFLFFVFSMGILFSLYMLLNSMLLINLLKKEKELGFRKVAMPILDNLYKFFGWFLFFLIFFLLLSRTVVSLAQGEINGLIWVKGYFIDFCINLVTYVCLAMTISLMEYQVNEIFHKN